eukprot:10588351-Heterocapsa_arctica.AAC.1
MPSRRAANQRWQQDGRVRSDGLKRQRPNASGTRHCTTSSWAERHADDRRRINGIPACAVAARAE